MLKNKKKVICIGLNHAGVSAIKALTSKSQNFSVTAYEQDDNLAFLSCGIALWIKKQVKNINDLFQTTVEVLVKEHQVNVNLKHRVLAIDKRAKKIKIKNLSTDQIFWDTYDKLIISTGSRLRKPLWKGIDLPGIFIVKNFFEGKTLIDFLEQKKIKKVAVIGAGYVGIEFAEAFFDNQKEVMMFDVSPRVMCNYFDEEFTTSVEKTIQDQKIKLFLNTNILGFEGTSDGVQKILTNKGVYFADMVVVCVGMQPNSEIVDSILDLTNDKFIKVNQFFQTSDPDIYACGDCIKVFDNSCLQQRNLGLASNSVRTGINVALNLVTDNKHPFLGVQATSAVNVFGWKILSSGINAQCAARMKIPYKTTFFEDYSLPSFMPSKKVKIKLCWNPKTRCILGCQIASQENHSEAIYFFSLAILKKLTIDELAMVDLFFLPHFNKPDNFITQVALRAIGIELKGV